MPNEPELEYQGYSIVVIGSFNPTIFQPLWFSNQNLLPLAEATNNTKIEIIHRNATVFSTDWFSMQVTLDRFQVDTSDPAKAKPLRDLAAGTFSILEHTPVTLFGFNSWGHFRMPSIDNWHAFGHHFAPKESWHAILNEPGMFTLTIQGKREDRDSTVRVTLEPSKTVQHGVFISVNEEFNLSNVEHGRIEVLLKALQESWDEFTEYAKDSSNSLLASYNQPKKKKRS